MKHVITEYMHQRECVIADLQLKIANIISTAAIMPEGVTPAEVLIALNGAAQRWAREIHKQNIEANDPANSEIYHNKTGKEF